MMEQIRGLLQTAEQKVQLVTVWDVIDIVIVAFIIYRVLLFIRKSRSGQVARAIVILLVALVISNMAHLNVINFVLSSAVELGFIALVIVFQPELRRFLERIGSGRLKEMFVNDNNRKDEEENAILETVEAYTAFSRDKVGALMVFERKTLLDDVIKTGTALECGINAELLKNLFWNKAPLHDGAVIVRGGRIVGAGCMLPLSGNVNLSRDLGMRHRAGIGISENSDAVVAIVSEETGSISVAINGMLKRHLSAETFERLLRKELFSSEETESNPAVWFASRFRKKGETSDGKETPGQ